MPIFIILVMFPNVILSNLFGSGYSDAVYTMQILALGFFIHSILGSSGYTLVSIGQVRFLMWSGLIAVIANIIMNIILIPPMGIFGAALATAIVRILISVSWIVKLYTLLGVQPFTMNYIKPAVFLPQLCFGVPGFRCDLR